MENRYDLLVDFQVDEASGTGRANERARVLWEHGFRPIPVAGLPPMPTVRRGSSTDQLIWRGGRCVIWRVSCSRACAGVPRHHTRQIARHKTRHLFHRRLAEIAGALAGRCPEVSTLPPGQTPPSQRRKKEKGKEGSGRMGGDGGGAGPARKSPEGSRLVGWVAFWFKDMGGR